MFLIIVLPRINALCFSLMSQLNLHRRSRCRHLFLISTMMPAKISFEFNNFLTTSEILKMKMTIKQTAQLSRSQSICPIITLYKQTKPIKLVYSKWKWYKCLVKRKLHNYTSLIGYLSHMSTSLVHSNQSNCRVMLATLKRSWSVGIFSSPSTGLGFIQLIPTFDSVFFFSNSWLSKLLRSTYWQNAESNGIGCLGGIISCWWQAWNWAWWGSIGAHHCQLWCCCEGQWVCFGWVL